MSLDDWEAMGIVCGALLAFLALLTWIWKKVVKPMRDVGSKTLRRVGEVADDLLGDKAKGIPSLRAEVQAVKAQLAEHVWRGHPDGVPAGAGRPTPNSDGTARSQPTRE